MPTQWESEIDGLCAFPIRVLRQPRWRVDDEKGALALEMDATGGTSWMHLRVAPMLDALADGATLATLVRAGEAADPARSRSALAQSARALVAGLALQGNLRVETPRPPEVFDGRFEVERELGRGGVGVAWLCRDRETGGQAVVKHAWNWSGPIAARDRSVRAEGDALARVDHSGIARLFARFDIDGRHHLARAFAPGEDLARLRARGALGDSSRRVDVLRQVADILAHMHERGLLCLDVNPANFVADGGMRVMLADLGHARASEAPLGRGRWGMEGFAAPDVGEGGDAYSTRADVYGLGALALFLASGRNPARDGSLDARHLDALAAPERKLVEACVRVRASERPAEIQDAIALLD